MPLQPRGPKDPTSSPRDCKIQPDFSSKPVTRLRMLDRSNEAFKPGCRGFST